ncbi:MAG: S9 family peptidase [Pseudomonadota bacterium]
MRTPLICLLATCSGLSVAAAQSPLTAEDLLDIEPVLQVAQSPDGAATAYTLGQMPDIIDGEENGTMVAHVRIDNGPGTDRVYVPKSMAPSALQWQNATTLLFLGKAHGEKNTSVYKVDKRGGAPELVFQFDRSIRAYKLSADGKTLFFSARDKADPTVAKLKNIGFNANIVDETARFTRLYRVNLSVGKAKQLDLEGNVSAFDVSPNGRQVVVALADTPLIGDGIINRTFHIVDAKSGKVASTLQTKGKIGKAVFSPNGKRVGLLAGVDRADPVAQTFGIADIRSGKVTFLTAQDDADELNFMWVDNNNVRILAHEGTGSRTYQLNVDSGEMSNRQIHNDVVVTSIDGGSNNYAAIGHSPTTPLALYKPDENGALQKQTNYNEWISSRALGEQREVTWRARDGVTVQGLLITPKGRTPRDGWPTITVVHGGPEAHYSNGWITRYSDPGHIGASRGFAVFYPNYRGSTGRGQGFAKLDHADPPAAEFNDVVDGINSLAEEGIVDPKRVGITGGSYGGYASAWGATALTEHFAASVAFVGLTDLPSFMGTTDIPTEMIDSHLMVPPEGNWDLYVKNSPIYHASKSKTPTLILHGEADPRVHPSQSLQLYRYLKRVGGAPVRLVTYPGEGHGNRKAAGQYDYSLRQMRWMEHYLQGPGGDMPPHSLPELEELAD